MVTDSALAEIKGADEGQVVTLVFQIDVISGIGPDLALLDRKARRSLFERAVAQAKDPIMQDARNLGAAVNDILGSGEIVVSAQKQVWGSLKKHAEGAGNVKLLPNAEFRALTGIALKSPH